MEAQLWMVLRYKTQEVELPDGVSLPVSAVGCAEGRSLLLLTSGTCGGDGQHPGTLPLLAALLQSRLPSVLHPQPHEPLLRTDRQDVPWPNIYLESKGTSVCQVTAIGATVTLLYTSRACYNLLVLALTNIKSINSFDYDWYNVSDQADLQSTLGDAGYIVFGVILFVWELLPTSLVVYFFRVRRPNQDKTGTGLPGHVFSSRAYFFDDPRRYDSR
ncbi:hypothetical protein J4Q44_G00015600 [Coregonus suidteri]|uniref:G protein-coupled receptor 137 n=1 Tax=Coregonus suidteri TaxID=861788 RepID=A0AAN8MP07_9TELE